MSLKIDPPTTSGTREDKGQGETSWFLLAKDRPGSSSTSGKGSRMALLEQSGLNQLLTTLSYMLNYNFIIVNYIFLFSFDIINQEYSPASRLV